MQQGNHIVKKLLVLIVASMASSLFLYALVSKDQPARHSGLKATDLPPLIYVHDLYAASNGTADIMSIISESKAASPHPTGSLGIIASRLTFPHTNPNPGPLPAVLLINSEPASGTGPDSGRTVQFLTNRGYVVLSIDCGNYANAGKTGMETAPRASGTCTETTIADEARNLINQGIADPAAMAIVGSGVGGYLALMTMSLEPDLFKAAIVHSAFIDHPNHFHTGSLSLKPQQAVLRTGLQPADTDQYAMGFLDKSPIDLVGNIQGAVLMTHGKADSVVPVSQAKAYARALYGSRKDAEIIYFNHEDHCYSRWQTQVQVARLTETFLARRLGGRDGGYDYIELLAKVF